MLGKQGAGKGTQCIRLSRHYVCPHISTGDMFRNAVRSRSEAGMQAKAYMDAGELIPDSVVIGLVAERLGHTDTANRGFVLDGFPRTVAQAEALAELLAPRGLDLVINLEVETEIVLQRLASRRVCTDCGANYSATQPPRVDWVCDICGGEVVQREDDTEAAIRRRLELYERETAPLIAWYAAQGMLAAINGMGPPDDVAARLVRVVEESRHRGLVESARNAAAGAAGVAAPAGDGTEAALSRGFRTNGGPEQSDGAGAGTGGAESRPGTGGAESRPGVGGVVGGLGEVGEVGEVGGVGGVGPGGTATAGLGVGGRQSGVGSRTNGGASALAAGPKEARQAWF
jgi:adenylate kinase